MVAPLVTILTPTYNHASYLAEGLDSVLAQTYPQWELLILDDGSTDGTGEIAKQYAAQDPRIRYLPQASKGIWRLAETYNTGLAAAQGKYIAVLEGDDVWPADKLARQTVWHITMSDLVFSHGSAEMVGDRANPIPIPAPFTGALKTERVLAGVLLRKLFMTAATVMINRAVLERVGGFQSVRGFPAVDLPTWIRLCQEPGVVYGADALLGYWRVHAGQTSQDRGVEMAVGSMQIRIDGLRGRRLPGVSESVIRAMHRPIIAGAYLHRLQHAIQARNRLEAYQSIAYVIRHGPILHKLQALRSVTKLLY